jgi:hypothetical protein
MYESRDGIPDGATLDEGPENVEWHEFTHHLTHTFVHPYACVALRPALCESLYPGVSYTTPGHNHAGGANPDTADSLFEGLAMFLPAVAAQQIDDVVDSSYDGIGDLEVNTKAWENHGSFPGEDVAVASLLWDLMDAKVDKDPTQVITSTSLHIPYEYSDTISNSLSTLWSSLTTSHPRTVKDLRLMFESPAITVRLDADSTADIAPLDMVFLMHGFFPINEDQLIHPNRGIQGRHYDVGAAERSNPALPRNAWIGQTDHLLRLVPGGPRIPVIPRFNAPSNRNARVGISVRDASGTPISGAEVSLIATTSQVAGNTGTEQTFTTTRRIENGDNAPLHYEPPIYFSYELTPGEPLPPCDPVNDTRVNVTVSATINGYTSPNRPSFDNCSFWQAVTNAPGMIPVAVTLSFPEDSGLPVTSMYRVASESVLLDSTLGYWAFELTCADPVDGGFATGCKRTEYRVDGGDLVPYRTTVVLKTPGLHLIEFRSVDAVGNAEPFKSIRLGVGVDPDTDGDGLSDRTEVTLGTNPQDPDSDDDGLADGFEVTYGINPLVADTDGDGLNDGREIQLGTDVLGIDSDSDDVPDGEEVDRYRSNPLDDDTDNDGVIDGPDNCLLVANPAQIDTDSDRYGNRCDPDFNNNDTVDSNDASLLRARLGRSATLAPDQDLNDSGTVTSADMAILISMFRKPPGPSTGGGDYD